jgi:hypothetical protein
MFDRSVFVVVLFVVANGDRNGIMAHLASSDTLFPCIRHQNALAAEILLLCG